MSLTGIIKISTSAFLFSRSAAEVDVKKLPTSAAHTVKSDEFCAVLRWHTGDGSQNAPAGTSLRVPFTTSGPVLGRAVFNHTGYTIDRLIPLHFFFFFLCGCFCLDSCHLGYFEQIGFIKSTTRMTYSLTLCKNSKHSSKAFVREEESLLVRVF